LSQRGHNDEIILKGHNDSHKGHKGPLAARRQDGRVVPALVGGELLVFDDVLPGRRRRLGVGKGISSNLRPLLETSVPFLRALLQ
jgi:hypothetical protein